LCFVTGYKIPVIENLGATLVSRNFCSMLKRILFGTQSLLLNFD